MQSIAGFGESLAAEDPSPDGRPGAAGDNRVLVLDDNELMRSRIARALAAHGLEPIAVGTREAALAAIDAVAPAYGVIETHLAAGLALDVVAKLRAARPEGRIVVVTAFGSIPLAVAAVKSGAADVLVKPANVDDLAHLLLGDDDAAPPANPSMSPARMRWEHITSVYEACGHNVSETARRLSMHRRSLQRILSKRAPR